MKPFLSISSRPSCRRARESAFTLVELMVATGVFLLVVLAVISSQLVGMKMNLITQSKLNATYSAREVLNHVRDEIRSGRILTVGNGSSNNFTLIAANFPQQGNALQINPTTDTNAFVRYYLDPTDQKLKRIASGSKQVAVIASCITNQLIFRAEDYLGNALTNDQNNRVIKMTLEFYQWEFSPLRAGAGSLYDYCRLQTRITRRAIE